MAGKGLNKFVERHIGRLESGLEDILAGGDPRAVHRFRVSTRRLTEPLELLREVESDVSKPVKKARKALKKLRKTFNAVRDLDVLRTALKESKDIPRLSAPAAERLDETLAAQRRMALANALDRMSATSPIKVIGAVRELFEDVAGKGGDRRSASLLEAAREMWRDRAESVLTNPPREEQCASFHKARVQLKGLRYCTELLYQMEGREDDAVLSAFVGIQDALGAWNDHHFAARRLSQLATDETVFANDPVWSATLLEHAAARVRQSQENRRDAFGRWPALREMIEVALLGHDAPESMSVDAAAMAAALSSVVGEPAGTDSPRR